jgi:hypothetical protein
VKTTLHEIPLERRTLHGHFSRDLEPVAEVRPGDVVRFATLDAGWGLEPPREDGLAARALLPARRGAGRRARAHRAARGPRCGRWADACRSGSRRYASARSGGASAGGWSTPLNDRLGVGEGESRVLAWELDADAAVGRDLEGREVSLAPFLGVLGMPPRERGVHATGPPRAVGREPRLQGARRGNDALPPDSGRRGAVLGRRRARAAGRR